MNRSTLTRALPAILLAAIVVIITWHRFLLGGEEEYTRYENYVIFRQSFFHLIHGQDLYQAWPAEHWDLFKYSPAFALLMAPLSVLPDFPGLLAWNLLNSFVLFLALWRLSLRTERARLLAAVLILAELITSLQNSQSNGLVAGLAVLAFALAERRRMALASLCITLTVFIKLFGAVAFVLLLLYEGRRKTVLYCAGWMALLAALPLVAVSAHQLAFLYGQWFDLLQSDHSASLGLSVMGWLDTWFGAAPPKYLVTLAGAALLCLPLARTPAFGSSAFRLLFLASVLVWVVIFNHKAESPTFVVAVTGVAAWFFGKDKSDTADRSLLALVVLLTVLSPTDLFPRSIREQFVVPYALKAVPCIAVWIKIQYDLLTFRTAHP